MFVSWLYCSVKVFWMPLRSCIAPSLPTNWALGHRLLHSSVKWGYSVTDKICPVRIDLYVSVAVRPSPRLCPCLCLLLCVSVLVIFLVSVDWVFRTLSLMAVSCHGRHISQAVALLTQSQFWTDCWSLTRLRKLILLSGPPFVYGRHCNRVRFHQVGVAWKVGSSMVLAQFILGKFMEGCSGEYYVAVSGLFVCFVLLNTCVFYELHSVWLLELLS